MKAELEGHFPLIAVFDGYRAAQAIRFQPIGNAQLEIEGVDRLRCIVRFQSECDGIISGFDDPEGAGASEPVWRHVVGGVGNRDFAIRALADYRKEQRRAPRPPGGVALPQPFRTIRFGFDRAEFGSSFGDLDPQVRIFQNCQAFLHPSVRRCREYGPDLAHFRLFSPADSQGS
ncbi:hypothetical protein FHX08_005467 [Rhizobium sp. BK529]|uniref:hypothetical protein n=1 Tax=Rhizobium sp. BK418 TaxID=2512120 RepID=UPI00180438D4|nr:MULTISPECIES: hypothetical protein [unclassified Rhizobium]MBB3595057.1 hypothetical protein [Rhizobium sp. BK529]